MRGESNCRCRMQERNAGCGAVGRGESWIRMNGLTLAVALFSAACASPHKSASPDPALLASIPAELRMMGAESTWVAKGVGYELVTRAKIEILPLMAQLDDQSRYFVKTFGAEPAKVIVAVRRVGPPGAQMEASAPVPFDAGPVVEMLVPRPLTDAEKKKAGENAESARGSGGRGGGGRAGRGSGAAGGAQAENVSEADRFSAVGPTARVVRAWLSARASTLTGKPATATEASANADDARVPSWAEDALPALAVITAREDTITARLAMQIDSLYPIHSFLTMKRPSAFSSVAGRGGRGEIPGGNPRGPGGMSGGQGGGGAIGGMGGMGGLGGRGNRGGMGGSGRGGGSSGGSNGGRGSYDGGRAWMPYSGAQLFAAQALTFGRYLTVREGPAFIGALVDAQLQSRSVNAVFDKAQMVPSNIEQLDIEFHRWLIDRAAHGR